MQTEGLTPALQADGSVNLTAKDGSLIYTIPAPYMIDEAEAVSYEAAYTLEEENGEWLLTVTADEAWMNDPARSYPVRIDPTITEEVGGGLDVSAAFVRSGYPAAPDTSDTGLYVGYYNNSNKLTRSYFHVNQLINLPAGCEINYAGFALYQSAHTGAAFQAGVYALRSAGGLTASADAAAWQNWANGLTWNQVSGAGATTQHEDILIDRQELSSGNAGSYIVWDITKLAYEWYEKEDGNLGFALISLSENQENARATLYGPKKTVNRPRMAIAYRNTRGVEPIYTYQQANIGRAGVSYVSDFSMQNTLIVPLFTSPSNVMPFSLSLVYNSSMPDNYFSSSYTGVHTTNFDSMRVGIG